MGIFLLLLFVSPVHNVFEGTCPRQDPSPGDVVVSPGSKLVLTCSGHMRVNGAKVSLNRSSSNSNKRKNSSDVTPAVPEESRRLKYIDTRYTASPHMVQPTRATRSLKDESDWAAEEMYDEGDYEEEEEEGESRVTRGIKLRPEWKWNKMTVGKGDRDWGGIAFGRNGAALSVASVRPTDSGKYTCHHRGKEKFSVKVIVADPPEVQKLYCYKKSPSSKIRCEGLTQKFIIKRPDCYLLLSKSPTEKLSRFNCSYSSQHSRCWCALDSIEDEKKIIHMVYLCVTSITGNATSPLLYFTPLGIVKPDPPSNVLVQQERGQGTRLTVSWSLPTTWKQQDYFYKLIYEIQYKPVKPSLGHGQVIPVEDGRSATITDIMSGADYQIQVRTREEFDGHWSEWSTPVYARSWIKNPHPPSNVSVKQEEGQETTMTVTWNLPANMKKNFSRLIYEIKYKDVNSLGYDEEIRLTEGECSYTITDALPGVEYLIQLRLKEQHDAQWSNWSKPVYGKSWTASLMSTALFDTEGSGADMIWDKGVESAPENEWLHHALWVSGLIIILSVILALYIFRHKDRFMPKLFSLNIITQYGDSSQPPPSASTAPEQVALVTFVPVNCKERPPSDENKGKENEEEETVGERTEAMHFNNTSYFFLRRE